MNSDVTLNNLIERFKSLAIAQKILIIFGIICILVIMILPFFVVNNGKSANKPISSESKDSPVNISPNPETTITETSETTITLTKGQKREIPEKNLGLTLIEMEGEEDCIDCITTTKIDVTYNDQTEQLIYVCGGFSGECTTILDAFNYNVEIVEQLNSNTILVKVTNL